jgi:hypothetical protein
LIIKKTIHPIRKEKAKVADELYANKCFLCNKKFGKYFSYHHLNYREDRKTYKDFGDTIQYHKYVLPEIKGQPERFILLCRGHHDILEWAVSIKNPDFWGRFFLAIMCTDSSRGESLPESSTTKICLENNKVVAYTLNNKSALKTYLERYLTLDSMFGEAYNETK